MVEVIASIGIAIATGGAVLTRGIHKQIALLERRIDALELQVARDYVSKSDFENTLTRFESHIIRIEQKLDAIAKNGAR